MKIITVGASSEIAKATSSLLSKKYVITNLTRNYDLTIEDNSFQYIQDYNTLEIKKFLAKLNAKEEHVFIFFNGVADSKIFINLHEKEIHNIINANLVVPILFVHNCLAKFINKRSKYIFLTSSRALNGDRGIALYSSTKSALKYLGRSLSLEYGKFNQYFYVISLGLFNFGLIKTINTKTVDKLKKDSAISDFVKIEDFVRSIEFCINTDSATGSIIYADNGYF